MRKVSIPESIIEGFNEFSRIKYMDYKFKYKATNFMSSIVNNTLKKYNITNAWIKIYFATKLVAN